jgi:hypothetical protein
MTTFFVVQGKNENPVAVVNNVQPIDTNILFKEIINTGNGEIQSSNRFIDTIKKNPKKSIAAGTMGTAGAVGIINSFPKEEQATVKDGKSMVIQSKDPSSNNLILTPKPVFNNPTQKDENISQLSKDEDKSASKIYSNSYSSTWNPWISSSKPLSSSMAPINLQSTNTAVIHDQPLSNGTSLNPAQPITSVQGSKDEVAPKKVQPSPKNFNETTKNTQGIMGKKIHLQEETLIIEDEVVNNTKAKEELVNNLKKIPIFYKWFQIKDNDKVLNDILNYENNFYHFKDAYGNKDLKKFLNNMNVLNTIKDFFLNS